MPATEGSATIARIKLIYLPVSSNLSSESNRRGGGDAAYTAVRSCNDCNIFFKLVIKYFLP